MNLPPNKEFEKKIQNEYLDDIYRKMGFEIAERIPPGKFGEYDVVLEKGQIRMRMEEKIIRHKWDYIVVELIEDMASGKQGWFFKVNADYLVWCFCENKKPVEVWSIKWSEFKRWYCENFDKFKMTDRDGQIDSAFRVSREGWGTSLFQLIPLEAIPDEIKKNIYKSKWEKI